MVDAAAALMPITSPSALASGPPESPGTMSASIWMRLLRRWARLPDSSLAVMLRPSALTLPVTTDGVPPWPPALPSATTASPTRTVSESPILTTSRPLAS